MATTSWISRTVIGLERTWDATRRRIAARRPPEDLRIVAYLGHGGGPEVVVRGRVLDDPERPSAIPGEDVGAAVRRTLARFLTDELPDVRLRVRVGGASVETRSDDEGYFDLRIPAGLTAGDGPWAVGDVELVPPYRGLTTPVATRVQVRIPGSDARFGIISDVDDTILQTGAQRAATMIRQTFTGSALTRVPFTGAPELYRALAGGESGADANPLFYVSSSPWNLHGFLVAFLEHREFPSGPLLLRDLLGSDARRTHASHKLERIGEVLELHPDLAFVLIGDSGQHDPAIYAQVVRENPGRILAVYIREVRLDTADGRVEEITDAWDQDVPFVLAADSAAVAQHAADLGLIAAHEARHVEQVVAVHDEQG